MSAIYVFYQVSVVHLTEIIFVTTNVCITKTPIWMEQGLGLVITDHGDAAAEAETSHCLNVFRNMAVPFLGLASMWASAPSSLIAEVLCSASEKSQRLPNMFNPRCDRSSTAGPRRLCWPVLGHF